MVSALLFWSSSAFYFSWLEYADRDFHWIIDIFNFFAQFTFKRQCCEIFFFMEKLNHLEAWSFFTAMIYCQSAESREIQWGKIARVCCAPQIILHKSPTKNFSEIDFWNYSAHEVGIHLRILQTVLFNKYASAFLKFFLDMKVWC